jgi:CHASE1-domain containing sensor protein
VLAATTWPDVGLALVTLLPGLAAAFFAYKAANHARRNTEALKTPSKTSIGKQVEDALQTAIANNYRLQAMAAELDVPMPEAASKMEEQVEALNDVQTRAQRKAHGETG